MGRFLLGCGFAFAFSLVGCGNSTDGDDDDGDNNGPTGGTVPLEQLPTRVAEVICKKLYECCTAAMRAEDPFVGSTEAECRTNTAALFTLVVPIISSSVAGGRARYDGDIYGECLASLDAAGCSPSQADSDCAGALVPLVPPGGACSQDNECIGTTCLGESGAAGMTDGVCSAPLANGEYCESDDDCASGFCPFNCEPKVPNGSACYDDVECESDNCDPDTYVCVPASNSFCE